MGRHWANLRYLLRHKWLVFRECRKLRVPLWIAITHDWDKFLPDEWLPYARAFYAPDGTPDPHWNDAATYAKMLHMNRNKHHWQHWLFVGDSGDMRCLPMPDVYRREMLADWRAAGEQMGKPDLLGWYTECRETMQFHPETRVWLEEQLGYRSTEN